MDLISVIVPVYKVEKYLKKCIESIISQTYTNIEIILVDDGSPDNCGLICDEFAKKDSRVVVIHQQNSGPSAARNAGTDVATGDYISFVDSDDSLDSNYFDCMIRLADKGDFVSCVVVDEDESGMIVDKKRTNDRCYSTIEALSEMCYERKLGTSACGKLLRKEIVKENRFPVGKLYEDLFTVYKWYICSKTVVSTSGTAYHYVRHFGSISNNYWNNKTIDLMDAADNLLLFIESEFPMCYPDAVYRYFFSANEFLVKAYRSDDYKKVFSKYQKKLKKLWKDLDKRKISIKDYIKFKLMTVSPKLHKLLYVFYSMRK